jgi:hypothetical protein
VFAIIIEDIAIAAGMPLPQVRRCRGVNQISGLANDHPIGLDYQSVFTTIREYKTPDANEKTAMEPAMTLAFRAG